MTFITATQEEHCHECGETIPPDAWMLPAVERSPSLYVGHFHVRRVVYCADCGRLYQESQAKTGSRTS